MQLTAQSHLPSTRSLIWMDMLLVGAFALVLLAFAPWLSDALDLPLNLLRGAGAILVPWTVYLAITWKQPCIPRNAVMTVFLVNAAWILASLEIVATGVVDPNGLGLGFILFQAAGVSLLAICQYLRWRTMD